MNETEETIRYLNKIGRLKNKTTKPIWAIAENTTIAFIEQNGDVFKYNKRVLRGFDLLRELAKHPRIAKILAEPV